MANMANENKYYVAIGTDLRVIKASDIGQSYYEFMKELREEIRYSESHVGIMRVDEKDAPSQG